MTNTNAKANQDHRFPRAAGQVDACPKTWQSDGGTLHACGKQRDHGGLHLCMKPSCSSFRHSDDAVAIVEVRAVEPAPVANPNPCECSDPGCEGDGGHESSIGNCGRPSSVTLYRVDIQDYSGTRMCEACADDAYASGVFTSESDAGDDDLPREPTEDDLITEDHIHVYQYGKLVVTTTPEAFDHAVRAVRAFMAREQFYPDVWFVSDHGNAHLIDLSE